MDRQALHTLVDELPEKELAAIREGFAEKAREAYKR